MPRTFVDALADAIVRALNDTDSPFASSGPARRTVKPGRRRSPATDALDPQTFARIASSVAARLSRVEGGRELPLEAIEI